MRRSKLLVILVPLTIGILLFSFASTVQAKKSTVTFRPLSHWEINNPGLIYAYLGLLPGYTWDTYPEGAYGLIFSYWWSDLPNSPANPDPDTYDGNIKERELQEGGVEITVNINLKDWKILYVRAGPDPGPFGAGYALSVFDELTMSGKHTFKFILPEAGMELPSFWEIVYLEIEGVIPVFEHITASGFGILSSWSATYGFTPGARAKVTVVQTALFKPPFIDPFWGMWPVELVNINELK